MGYGNKNPQTIHIDNPNLDAINEQLAEKANIETFPTSTVFTAGVDFNSNYFRIPALCITKHGTIIAAAEARYQNSSDFGIYDVVTARSTDYGKTWNNKQIAVLHNNVNPSYSRAMSPTFIYDESNDKIYLFANKNDDNIVWFSKTDSTNWDCVFVTSTDDGVTWSAPISIKSIITPYSSRIIFLPGIGSGIVMANGTLVVPVTCSYVGGSPYSCSSGIAYSTDHGATWTLSSALIPEFTSECNIVESSPGTLLINARLESSTSNRRALYSTTDLGGTWTALESNSDLSQNRIVQQNKCMGSTIKVVLPNQKEKLLFSSPYNNSNDRSNLSVLLSDDYGNTWNMLSSIYKPVSLGYSCLAYRDSRLFILMEISYNIVFKEITSLVSNILRDKGTIGQSTDNYLLYNQINNSDFRNAGQNWTLSNASNFTSANNEASFQATATNGFMSNGVLNGSIIGHIYYVQAQVKSSSTLVRLTFGNGTKFVSSVNNYEKLSLLYTATAANHSVAFVDTRTSGWDPIYVKQVMVIDLTALFGAGYEPTDISEMGYLLSNLPNSFFATLIQVPKEALYKARMRYLYNLIRSYHPA